MKKAIFRIFKPKVHRRAVDLKHKQDDRLARLTVAVNTMREYSDLPMSHVLGSLCREVGIKQNEAARQFFFGLLVGNPDLKEEAKKLPLT